MFDTIFIKQRKFSFLQYNIKLLFYIFKVLCGHSYRWQIFCLSLSPHELSTYGGALSWTLLKKCIDIHSFLTPHKLENLISSLQQRAKTGPRFSKLGFPVFWATFSYTARVSMGSKRWMRRMTPLYTFPTFLLARRILRWDAETLGLVPKTYWATDPFWPQWNAILSDQRIGHIQL